MSGDVSLLQTESAAGSETIEARAVKDIPTQLDQFQNTLPGVIKGSRYMGSMELCAFGTAILVAFPSQAVTRARTKR